MAAIETRGTWLQRFLIRFFCVCLAVLIYWLLGFVLQDLNSIARPDYSLIEKDKIDGSLLDREVELQALIAENGRELQSETTKQELLRDSTSNAQITMNQLLRFQEKSLENAVTPTSEEQTALAKSQEIFLSNQQQYQDLSIRVGELKATQRELNNESEILAKKLVDARQPIRDEYATQLRRHSLGVCAAKLAILIPILLFSLRLFYVHRNSLFLPVFVAIAVAASIKAMQVMHEHLPARAFKYFLIITFLVIVSRVLVSLIRSISKPAPEFLLRQFREAYETFLCPVCSFPIRRGPLKYLYWTRRTVKKISVAANSGETADEPYSCPSCSTKLYETCSECGRIRASLLPSCEHCGHTNPVVSTT
ncbi:hypothetical protein SH668x_000435 [Planctomicrobium sp. SH668]|uniref:hypothetical protein n=1 Tax=Planctomicrobium sp. SH668 TaxID=3448126 RepID=UPI003F5AE88D